MRDKPDATDLLATARRTLLDELLPQLPSEYRYTGLMIAAAMAVARREIAAGQAWQEAERAALVRLMGDQGPDATLDELNREFAQRLRRGDFDGALRDAAVTLLRETTLVRLAECNPDYPAER